MQFAGLGRNGGGYARSHLGPDWTAGNDYLEVTRAGELVWEWVHPEVRDGKRATIYRAERLDVDVLELLESRL